MYEHCNFMAAKSIVVNQGLPAWRTSRGLTIIFSQLELHPSADPGQMKDAKMTDPIFAGDR